MKQGIVLTVLAILINTGTALSQLKQPDEPKLLFASINVTDIDSSVAWYERILLLKTGDRSDYPSLGYRQANLKNPSIHIELIQYDSVLSRSSFAESYPGKEIPGITKLGFSVKNFREWVGHLLMQDANFSGGISADRITGKPVMTIRDPDGNTIMILEE